MILKQVTVERFKRLEQVVFDLSNVNVLIGGNNSGKSTLIQGIHFAFTLFQSLSISNKWPLQTKKTTTISPTELIYIPSEDPYSLGYGGRLLEDDEKAIHLGFVFDDGNEVGVRVRKGRITNILVEPTNVDLARRLSSLEAPFTIFSPGLAGVSRNESYVSDGVLLRVLARGDANIVLRNILYRLKQKDEWIKFESDLAEIFPGIFINVSFNSTVDQFILVTITDGSKEVPLDLAGTGLLQAIQILAYLHLFSPRIIILDEPDSHLHPNNQRLLCSLLKTISEERDVQVVITTHSRHVLDAMYNDARLLWVQEGEVRVVAPEDQIDLLMELGALDIKEKLKSGHFDYVVLTEDKNSSYFDVLLRNSGFDKGKTTLLPYNGVTSIHLLKPLIRQIKDISNAIVIVHRDRDYLFPDEIETWKKEIRALGAEPFVTLGIDIEAYFCSDEIITAFAANVATFDLADFKIKLAEGEQDEAITSYVNGRIDFERKAGTIGKLDYGRLSVAAAKAVGADVLSLMKGKRKLSKIRKLFNDLHQVRYEIDRNALTPSDDELAGLLNKHKGAFA
ncbi:AAA family ATPase [Rhizobium leguminosarum]|uniref:AAA family ATPase n=1 Tax=Rhizobium leguminosarum TaxID=384 RepID=UPI001C98004C|nr:ATP-binding protein [Rhizobium leguminosarum]MBY5549633.1 AAA family ATPase [Rhizobium leguminosarum]